MLYWTISMADQGVHPAAFGFVDDVSPGRAINGGKIRKFTWANIVNEAALRRMDTLIRHIDRPAKHESLLCRFRFWFWFVFLVFWFSFFYN